MFELQALHPNQHHQQVADGTDGRATLAPALELNPKPQGLQWVGGWVAGVNSCVSITPRIALIQNIPVRNCEWKRLLWKISQIGLKGFDAFMRWVFRCIHEVYSRSVMEIIFTFTLNVMSRRE